MNIKLDHIGWITNDLDKFEDFWVKGLGFIKDYEADLAPSKTKSLFGITSTAKVFRYTKDDIYIEIHTFNPPVEKYTDSQDFNRFGINHVSIWVADREAFLKELVGKVQYLEVRRFHDPGGWDNIFIRDYDGNWIEVRTTL